MADLLSAGILAVGVDVPTKNGVPPTRRSPRRDNAGGAGRLVGRNTPHHPCLPCLPCAPLLVVYVHHVLDHCAH